MNANQIDAQPVRVQTHAFSDVDDVAAALSDVQARMWVADRPSGAAWELLEVVKKKLGNAFSLRDDEQFLVKIDYRFGM